MKNNLSGKYYIFVVKTCNFVYGSQRSALPLTLAETQLITMEMSTSYPRKWLAKPP